MASLRQLRRRIRSIQSTKQVMRAMQLVSGSKFKRAQSRLLQARQVLGFLDGLLQRVLAAGPATGGTSSPERILPARSAATGFLDHPLCQRQEGPGMLVVFTSDAGLCGAYNANLIQLAEAELRRETARQTRSTFIGKRGHRYFTKRGVSARGAYLDLAGRPDIGRIDAIGAALMDQFLSGEVGSIRVLYATFVSPSVSRPVVRQWLPISLTTHHAPRTTSVEYLFEPTAQHVFEELLPRWALSTFRLLLLEAFTSEHGARMIAMKHATDNAQELVEDLTMQRNKLRQATITKELSELVGTAEALK